MDWIQSKSRIRIETQVKIRIIKKWNLDTKPSEQCYLEQNQSAKWDNWDPSRNEKLDLESNQSFFYVGS